jgi:hypothetical protein
MSSATFMSMSTQVETSVVHDLCHLHFNVRPGRDLRGA